MTEDFKLCGGVLTFPDHITYVRCQQFAMNSEIREVVIPPNIGFFEDEAFAECEALEKVVLPDNLITLGVAAFTSCVSLKDINIPASVKSVEEGTFLFCDSLRQITLPEGLEEIKDLAFQSSGLEKITIPESVRCIGEEAFFECENLTEANVLNCKCSIGPNAFGSNYNLVKGFIAPGFPDETSRASELLYSMLWASCPDCHSEETSLRASSFIRENQDLVMERIFKFNNVPAMTGIASEKLLSDDKIDEYVKTSLSMELTEITALLLSAKREKRSVEEEFEL